MHKFELLKVAVEGRVGAVWVDVASSWQVWEAFLQQKIYCELSCMLGFMQAPCWDSGGVGSKSLPVQ